MNLDYWKTHTVEQHEKALRAINERVLKGENVDVQKEITRLFGEDTWLFELKAFLLRQVNSQISGKMKDRYNTERTYFELRSKIETDVIASTNWFSYFEQIDLTELQNTVLDESVIHNATLALVVIEALKAYIDNGEERNIRCLLLHDLYLSLKNYNSRFTACEDGFIEFLNTKQHRIDLEDARLTGSICPFCSSTDVKSFGANWKCRTCGREFRKHRKKEEN